MRTDVEPFGLNPDIPGIAFDVVKLCQLYVELLIRVTALIGRVFCLLNFIGDNPVVLIVDSNVFAPELLLTPETTI